MQLVYLICLLLPLVAALHAMRGAYPGTSDVVPQGESRPSAVSRLVLLGLAVVALALFAAHAYLDRHIVFDDAFMSYRYASHLGQGIGLRWNPGEAPVEGFTNLLLVVVLAPLTRWGADPLVATRIISIAAALAIAVTMYVRSRRDRPVAVAIAVALTYLVSNQAAEIAMVGLETLWFAALVFLAFHRASGYIERGEIGELRSAGFLSFLAITTRPEAIFLALAISAVTALPDLRAGRLRQHLLAMGLTFWLPVAALFAFKFFYFGGLLPNPAYIKMNATGLLAESGVQSVRDFLNAHWKLVVAVAVSSALPVTSARARTRLLAAIFVLAYVVFYLRVDTLMDIHGRFLVPIAPFLFELARPLVERAHAAWLHPRAGLVQSTVAAIAFFFVAVPGHDATVTVVKRAVQGEYDYAPGPAHAPGRGHSYHIREKARLLGEFPGIEELTLACVDAGVLAYETRTRHIDTVGLNDQFIARERDLDRITSYLFGRRPDIVLHRSRIDGTPITYGHGVLGNTALWADHPGWNDYVYAGSILDVEPWRHELHVFVRADGRRARPLFEYVQERVADRVHPESPIALGTRPMATRLAP